VDAPLTMTTAPNSRSDRWRQRVAAIGRLPSILRLVWSAAPLLAGTMCALRVVIAAVPVIMLMVSRIIIDAIAALSAKPGPSLRLWWWVGIECSLALASSLLARASGLVESLVADRFS